MKLKPLGDRVLIEIISNDSILKGGILLPDSHNNKKEKGVVIEIGDKVEDLKNGDIILLPRYLGQNIDLEGKEYYIIRENEIIAIIGEDNG